MKKIAVGELRDRLPSVLRALGRGPVAITRSGKVCAAIVPLDELDVEAFTLGQSEKFAAIIKRSRQRARREGRVSMRSLEDELGLRKTTLARRRKKGTNK